MYHLGSVSAKKRRHLLMRPVTHRRDWIGFQTNVRFQTVVRIGRIYTALQGACGKWFSRFWVFEGLFGALSSP
jgi:hypothetical protein